MTARTVDAPLSDIRARLTRLVPYAHTRISSLPAPARQDYDSLIRYTNLLHGTPKYGEYYYLVVEVFGHIKPEQIKPATVASYFIGCLIQAEPQGNCSGICAGSLPRPETVGAEAGAGSGSCRYQIIRANMDNGRYDFTRVNDTPNSDAIVYVDNFTGFTEGEIQSLQQSNINRISIQGSDTDQINFIPLEQVPRRETPSRIPPALFIAEAEAENTGILVFIIILLSVAILAVAIMSRLPNLKKRSKKMDRPLQPRRPGIAINGTIYNGEARFTLNQLANLAISWDGVPNELYTLVFGREVAGGVAAELLIVNIPGTDITSGDIFIPYHGPWAGSGIFLVYRQSKRFSPINFQRGIVLYYASLIDGGLIPFQSLLINVQPQVTSMTIEPSQDQQLSSLFTMPVQR